MSRVAIWHHSIPHFEVENHSGELQAWCTECCKVIVDIRHCRRCYLDDRILGNCSNCNLDEAIRLAIQEDYEEYLVDQAYGNVRRTF